jgi:hypothetical protein
MNLFKWFKRNKVVPDYRTITDEVKFNTSGVPKDFKDREFKGAFGEEKEYPYNIEFGDGRTKEEMDKMQKELNLKMMNAPFQECGCLPDCGCKD